MKKNAIVLLSIIMICVSVACRIIKTDGSLTLSNETPSETPLAESSSLTENVTHTACPQNYSPIPTKANESLVTSYSFEECAKVVLSLIPYYTGEDDPFLPEDADNNQVRYTTDGGICIGPELFAVDDDTIIIGSIAPMMYDLKIFENNRFVRHTICNTIDHKGSNFVVVADGVLYKEIVACSCDNGEHIMDTAMPFIGNYAALLYQNTVGAQQSNEGEPTFIVCESMGKEGNYLEEYEFYQLDRDFRVWHKTETVCWMLPEYDGSITTLILNSGIELLLPDVGYVLIGRSVNGDLFLNKKGTLEKLIKISPDGIITAEVEIPYGDEERWDQIITYQLAEDGAVYVAMSLKDRYVVWKLCI